MSTKTNPNGTKINRLMRKWPKGTIATQGWLEQQGVYRQLTSCYIKSCWLNRIGRGVFIRADDQIDWTGGVYTLQQHLKSNVHVGGKTALNLQGLGHYIPLGESEEIFLFAAPKTKLPAWFRNYDWSIHLHFLRSNIFSSYQLGLKAQNLHSYPVTISAPERAIMEVLHLVPERATFEEAEQLLAGLTTLRPTVIQALLETCGSIKVKRLFMYLAEKSNHQWVRKINCSKINLGKGKRLIVPKGKLDPKYQITVPRNSSPQHSARLI